MGKTLFNNLLLAFCFNLFLPASQAVLANEEISGVEKALRHYIDGTSFNETEKISQAFYENAELLLENKNKALWHVPVKEYVSWFGKRPAGKFNGRIGEIINIDIEGHIATAKVEILMPESNRRFIDMFLLKKLDDKWQIISKSAAGKASHRNGKRILFILSSAFYHGQSTLPAGASFSEIVNAYETFKSAGYTVDFVSPEGGEVGLAYINTSEPLHRKYVYDQDFMFALENTKKPSDIKAKNYLAVHYVGGSSAMYGVADNPQIQQIAMDIYEKHNGIVSSVCHGTAGIAFLKTSDGRFLVEGKRISGYPDDYENPNKPYFNEFPFLIKKTIVEHGGEFLFSDRNTPHVEVDGRIVTGQNYLSSELVAKKMIEILEQSSR